MPLDILVGLQYGDEGKGKVVDSIASNYSTVVRFNGGNNAGHTVQFEKTKLKLHSLPSGIAHKNIMNVIGRGCVINPEELISEIRSVQFALNRPITSKQLLISKDCTVILPEYIKDDQATVKSSIGTTGKGIGPTYSAKHARTAKRLSEVIYDYPLLSLYIGDAEGYIERELFTNRDVLAEGAQGTWLDLDHGEYPYVTSCNTLASHACTTLGVGINKVRDVIGVFKAYTTRVGNGYLDSEWSNNNVTYARIFDVEVGTTTGRSRRCGPLDLPKLQRAVFMNGVTKLVMTKADMLDNTEFAVIEDSIHLKTFESWEKASVEDANFIKFMEYIENELGAALAAVSNGPNRKDYDCKHGLTKEFMVK